MSAPLVGTTLLTEHPGCREHGIGVVGPRSFADRKGLDVMSDQLASYWYVAAVFREPGDLATAVADLRGHKVSAGRLLVIANHTADEVGNALKQAGPVPIVSVDPGGAKLREAGIKELPHELHALLNAMYDSDPREAGDAGDDGGRAQVYVQLRQDVADGAFVLIASVPNPDEQLLGARALLRANCECVLTHEMAAEPN